MRLAFMGTPDFSVPVLDALVEAGHEIAAVYSQPPRPAGRGKKERPTPVAARAEALGGGAYGMEALNVLRIEKGFITHSEIDGRVTAQDIGMERMLSKKKDFIGATMAQRPGLTEEGRGQLVGMKPIGPVKQLTAGAHLYSDGEDPVRAHDQGYVTSVGFSPTLGHFLGLGFVRDGLSRHGEVLNMVDHVRGIQTRVELCDPVAFDKDGGRTRG